MKSHAINKSRKSTREAARMRLSGADAQAFLAVLDDPPAPNEALRAAAALHRESVDG